MKQQTLSKQEVEAQLMARTEAINHHLDALEDEVVVTGHVLLRFAKHPLVKVGATLVAGLVAGRFLGGLGRPHGPGSLAASVFDGPLLDVYADAIALETEAEAAEGRDPYTALRDALRRHPPMVVQMPPPQAVKESGLLGDTASLVFRVLMGMVVREGMAKAMSFLETDHPELDPPLAKAAETAAMVGRDLGDLAG